MRQTSKKKKKKTKFQVNYLNSLVNSFDERREKKFRKREDNRTKFQTRRNEESEDVKNEITKLYPLKD